jgi:hypothetical protein
MRYPFDLAKEPQKEVFMIGFLVLPEYFGL